MFFALPLTFFIAKLIDIHGVFGVPGTGESIPGVFWGALAVSLVFGFFFFRSLIRPRVVRGEWTPRVHADVGPVTIYCQNRRWTTTYDYRTSHPSYSLLLLLTAPIPAVMLAATTNHGDNTFYWRATGIVGLTIPALMALARVLAWYVFRFGRRQVDDQAAEKGMSQRKLAWEIAWKPVLMLMVMVYAIVCIPLGWMWFQEKRTIAAMPVVAAGDAGYAGEYRRVEGPPLTDPVYWAPRGTGRGGNNYSGAGVLVELPSGGEALLLAESLSVPDVVGMMKARRTATSRRRAR